MDTRIVESRLDLWFEEVGAVDRFFIEACCLDLMSHKETGYSPTHPLTSLRVVGGIVARLCGVGFYGKRLMKSMWRPQPLQELYRMDRAGIYSRDMLL